MRLTRRTLDMLQDAADFAKITIAATAGQKMRVAVLLHQLKDAVRMDVALTVAGFEVYEEAGWRLEHVLAAPAFESSGTVDLDVL